MKQELLDLTTAHIVSLNDVQKDVRRYVGDQIQSRSLLAKVQETVTTWFDVVRPALQKWGFSPAILDENSRRFESLLKLCKVKPRKNVLSTAIGACLAPYKAEIIHNLEINAFSNTGLSIASFIDGLTSDEGEYLDEAQRCLSVDALRACIVLGWCATIARIQAKIGEIGYEKFSTATAEMFGKSTGRFKWFKKKHEVESFSELQRIFDTDILWVLEYMELIDGNQHERLRHCFEFRNNSAHPGLAPIKPANLYSFYSDISEIVLKNEKFAVGQSSATSAQT
jgi:hypothetical protein